MSPEMLFEQEFKEDLGLQREQDLYSIELYNSGDHERREVSDYVRSQEKTHLAEGMKIQQVSVRKLLFKDGHVRGFGEMSMVETNVRGLHVAEESYLGGDEDVIPLIERRKHDVSFAKASDNLMINGKVGDAVMINSPYLEEQDEITAKKLGDWPEFKRGYSWLARKISSDEIEYVDISIDQSCVSTWRQTLANHGLNIPEGTPSHEVPRYILQIKGLVSDDQRDKFVKNFKGTYYQFNLPSEPLDHETDDSLEATEFLDKYAGSHLELLVDTHEAVARTLQTGELDDFVRLSANRALATLDCLNYLEILALHELLAAEQVEEYRHGAALANIIKAQRYGIWKLISKMVAGEEPLVEQDIVPTSSTSSISYAIDSLRLMDHVYCNTNEAAALAETMPGCAGGTSFLNMSPDEIKKSIFSSENYSFDRKMHCVVCQPKAKKEDPPKMCGPCGICRDCDGKLRKASSWQAQSTSMN